MTDEQVIAAIAEFYKSGTGNGGMRKALEAYEASKWVKFDEYDKSTYPPFDVRVLVKLKGDFGLRIDFMTHILEWHNAIRPRYVTHWQPLPEFRSES